MCQDSFANVASAHFCSFDEVMRAVSSGNYDDSISGQDTWTTSFTSFNRNGGSSFNSCQSLTYDSGDVSSGAVLRVDKNLESSGGGGRATGDAVNLIPNQGCGSTHKIMCCR